MLPEEIIIELERDPCLTLAYKTYEGGFQRVKDTVYTMPDPFIAVDILPAGIEVEEIIERMHYWCNHYGYWMTKSRKLMHIMAMSNKQLVTLFEYLVKKATDEVEENRHKHYPEPNGEMAALLVHNAEIYGDEYDCYDGYDAFCDHPLAQSLLGEIANRLDHDEIDLPLRIRLKKVIPSSGAYTIITTLDDANARAAQEEQNKERLAELVQQRESELIDNAVAFFNSHSGR